MKKYVFYGNQTPIVKPINEKFKKIESQFDLYDLLDQTWCRETCAPRSRHEWSETNKTVGQCSITAFLVQDIFGGVVRGILRPEGHYHCFNQIGDVVFDLTSEQFGDEKLNYDNCPEQFREVHFSKEEKRLRYEKLKSDLINLLKD